MSIPNTISSFTTTGLDAGLDIKHAPTAPTKNTSVITFVSNDGKLFTIDRKYTILSTVLHACEEDKESHTVQLPNVTGEMLSFVIRYLAEHKGVEPAEIQKPLSSNNLSEECPYKWDAAFIDEVANDQTKNYDRLRDFILTVNYLGIKSLLELACAKLAVIIRTSTLEHVKIMLGASDANMNVKEADSKKELFDEQDRKSPRA